MRNSWATAPLTITCIGKRSPSARETRPVEHGRQPPPAGHCDQSIAAIMACNFSKSLIFLRIRDVPERF
jgi:hypothetical protein